MNSRVLSLLVGAGLIGCGEKAQEIKNATNALEAVAQAGSGIAETQKEAEKFYNDRKAKGDTVAMPYAELQKMLPSAPSDYKASEDPSGSSQSMGAFSMSQTEQTFTMPAGADGSSPEIKVSIVDFGGTQAAYGMMALPMMMNLSQEDAHHRMQTLKIDMPYTWGSEEYNKDDKSAKVTLITRYRYVISVEARNQGEDKSAMARSLAEEIAKKFEGK
jgi:hypothetical protein